MRALLLLLVVIGGFYVILLLFLYVSQARLIYFPEPRLRGSPEQEGLYFEDVQIHSAGAEIHGWYLPADSGAPVVLFCHGNAGNMADRLEALAHIHAAGLAVLIFDYAGYGRSGGRPGEAQTYADAAAAYDWLLKRGYRPGEIAVYGRSLGGAVAAHVAQGKKLRALVLEATFTSMGDIAAVHYRWIPVRLLLRHKYETAKYLRNAEAPVVILHSPTDELMPFAMGKKLYELAPEPKRFIETHGGHNALAPVDWAAVLAPFD